jgi:hypothetical protein
VGCGPGWLSFLRIVDIPFEACVAALESWPGEGSGGGRQAGHGRLRGPVEHDQGTGTCRVEVRLARGPLRPLLRMRLHVDGWSSSSRTALELIPCRRVRATASYFRAGHLLLDSLTHMLQLEWQIQAYDLPAGDKAETGAAGSGSGPAGSHDLPPPNTLRNRRLHAIVVTAEPEPLSTAAEPVRVSAGSGTRRGEFAEAGCDQEPEDRHEGNQGDQDQGGPDSQAADE